MHNYSYSLTSIVACWTIGAEDVGIAGAAAVANTDGSVIAGLATGGSGAWYFGNLALNSSYKKLINFI